MSKYSLKKQYKKLIKEVDGFGLDYESDEEESVYGFDPENFMSLSDMVAQSTSGEKSPTLFQVFFPSDIPSDEIRGKTFVYGLDTPIGYDSVTSDIKNINARMMYSIKTDGNRRIGTEIKDIFGTKPAITGKSDTLIKNCFKRSVIDSMKQYLVCLSMKNVRLDEEIDYLNAGFVYLKSALISNFSKELTSHNKLEKHKFFKNIPLMMPGSKDELCKIDIKIGGTAYYTKPFTLSIVENSYSPLEDPYTKGEKNSIDILTNLVIRYWKDTATSEREEQIYKFVNDPGEKKELTIIQNAMGFYTSENLIALADLLKDTDNIENLIRKKYSTIQDLIQDFNQSKIIQKTLDFVPANTIGKGELALHLFSYTANPCLNIEPDAIINFENEPSARCSMKSFMSGAARTGTTPKCNPSIFLDLIYESFSPSRFFKSYKTSNIEKILVKDLIVDQGKGDEQREKLDNFYKLYNKDNKNDDEKSKYIDLQQEIGSYYEKIIKSKYQKQFIAAKIGYDIEMTVNQNYDVPEEPEESEALKKKRKKINKIYQFRKFEKINEAVRDTYLKKIKEKYNDFKKEVISEHNVKYVICISKDKDWFHIENSQINPDQIEITGSANSRVSFIINKETRPLGDRTAFERCMMELYTSKDLGHIDVSSEVSKNNFEKNEQNDSYKPKGNILKEVYSDLFKKKIVKEGGLGGHMRHPYENLDITPREMMDRIESYGIPQTVIDKVDGQNLFFTVERDGTLLFARNKQDMTHQDLVDKFTGHGAEAAFLEGGEAIKSGVEQWLSSAGNFAEQEILDIFHPTEDIRSFINFEIMHPKKSNQIQYDKKYIVFHSIVDFGEGRSQIFSSNQDERLKKLIGLMNPGVASTGFELASNREIDLNGLSNVQIMVYTDRIRDLIYELEMDEDEFLADGILRIIDKELAQEGISLEENTLKIMRDFVLYGEDSAGDAITSRDFTKHVSKEDAKKLRELGLTNAAKAKAKVANILSPFKEIFVDLGIDLLKGVKSAYLSPEKSDENIEMLRDKLRTAIEDYDQYMISTPKDELSKVALRLEPHVDKIKQVGIDKAVSTSVEGGVYTQDLDLEKITGGFAPLNQIVGAAYRDKEGIFPKFQNKFKKIEESKRYSLKSIFSI